MKVSNAKSHASTLKKDSTIRLAIADGVFVEKLKCLEGYRSD